MVTKQKIWSWTIATLWIAVGAGAIVLLVAAVRKEERQLCKGVNITIKGVSDNFFVDSTDIIAGMNQYIDGSPTGQPVNVFNLKSLETDLEKNVWVKDAQLYFDNNAVLQVIVTEREPVARIFTRNGSSFYIDSSITMLPLSEKLSARLPVFTNFPSDKAVLKHADSALLRDIYLLSMAIQKDAFRMAMVDQVDITNSGNFMLMPKIGSTAIAFGDASNAEDKFTKLLVFYQEVLPKCGWNYYSEVNLQYAGQVVAKRKDAEDKTADSLRTLQIMRSIAIDAEQRANDSLQVMLQDNEYNTTSVNLIQESIQRDDNGESATTTETTIPTKPQGIPVIGNPVLTNPLPMKNPGAASAKKVPVKKVVPAPAKKPAVKPVVSKPASVKPVQKPVLKPVVKNAVTLPKQPAKPALKPKPAAPKAVMPKTNDY